MQRAGSGVVIVGGSLAGVTTASALRAEGYAGKIVLVGDEPHAAYARPPLSKAFLMGSAAPEEVLLRPLSAALEIEAHTQAAATALDLDAREISLADGRRLRYDDLVIATGARARTVSDGASDVVLRTLDDCLSLREMLRLASSVAIIGGGYLGVELASACRQMSLPTTIVSRSERLLPRLGTQLSQMFTDAAVERGVTLKWAAQSCRITRAGKISLGQETIASDLILSAVGDAPNVEWLRGTGLASASGVVVDQWCRAAPHVLAAGDVAALRVHGQRRPERTPHWSAAIDQAKAAARTIVRGCTDHVYEPKPFFWTEAFGLNLKLCGSVPPSGPLEVLSGSLASRSALLRWGGPEDAGTCAAVNFKTSIPKLRALAQSASAQERKA